MAPSKKGSKKSSENGPVTRSKQKTAENIDITTYTTLNKSSERPIQVVSKRGLKNDPKQYEELEKRFERIEAKRKQNEGGENGTTKVDALCCSPDIWERRNSIFLVTHINVFLYATCFFIQVGTLPVRMLKIIMLIWILLLINFRFYSTYLRTVSYTHLTLPTTPYV